MTFIQAKTKQDGKTYLIREPTIQKDKFTSMICQPLPGNIAQLSQEIN